MKYRFYSAILVLASLLAGSLLLGGSVTALDIPSPPSKTAILDQAGVIDNTAEAALSQKLIAYKSKTGNEIAILTVKSLEGEDNFDYSYRVAQHWGVGSKEANNGVLFFVAVEDHKDFIQVGRGLEPYLTDLQASLILRQRVNPEFKKGNYTTGVENGVEGIIAVIGGERLSQPKNELNINGNSIEVLLFGGLFFLAYVASFLARSKSWWAGGVLGAVPGAILLFTASVLLASVVLSLGLVLGLLLDYVLSRNYRDRAASGDDTGFWGSGGGFWGGSGGFGSSSGGFGGFGGGGFGGGGAGGSW